MHFRGGRWWGGDQGYSCSACAFCVSCGIIAFVGEFRKEGIVE